MVDIFNKHCQHLHKNQEQFCHPLSLTLQENFPFSHGPQPWSLGMALTMPTENIHSGLPSLGAASTPHTLEE